MAKFKFEVERVYTWNIEVDGVDTVEEAEQKMWNETVFDEENAQRGHLEIIS